MVEILIERAVNGKIVAFTVSGHAGLIPAGENIICAAVSAVALTAASGLKEFLGRTGLYETSEGFLRVELAGEPDELTEAILATMVIGLEEIRRQEPGLIKMSELGR